MASIAMPQDRSARRPLTPPVAARSTRLRLLVALDGLVGLFAAVVIALGGPATGSGAPVRPRWFWGDSPLDDRSINPAAAVIVVRLALLVFAVSWVGLGLLVHQREVGVRGVVIMAALWTLPLLVVAPLFSDDAHLYVAYGDLARRGLDPYTATPAALGSLPSVTAVNGFWLNDSSPYGGLFLDLMSGIVRITGERPHLALVILRGIMVATMGGFAVLVARLATALGRKPAPALWLTMANPLVLLSALSGLHNDLLMLTPLMGAMLLAVHRRWLWAIALCAVAANIKVIALVVLAVVIFDRARQKEGPVRRFIELVTGSALGVAVFGLVGVASTHGFGWVHDLDVPGKAFTLITPTDSFTFLFHHPTLDRARDGALGLTAIITLAACLCLPRLGSVRAAGLALTAAALLGTVLWPWYLLWPVAFFAAGGVARERATIAFGSIALLFVTLPSGVPDFGTPNNRLITPHRAELIAVGLTLLAGVALGFRPQPTDRLSDVHQTSSMR